MSIQINLPGPDEMPAVKDHFSGENDLRDMMSALTEDRPAALPAHRLWRYASGQLPQDAELLAALHQDRKLSSDYNAMLKKLSWSWMPQVAAASTEEKLGLRETDHCAIRIEASRAEPDQVYVIIELKDQTVTPPATLICSGPEGQLNSMELPAPQGGVIQLLLQADDDVLVALQDHATEVFLR